MWWERELTVAAANPTIGCCSRLSPSTERRASLQHFHELPPLLLRYSMIEPEEQGVRLLPQIVDFIIQVTHRKHRRAVIVSSRLRPQQM